MPDVPIEPGIVLGAASPFQVAQDWIFEKTKKKICKKLELGAPFPSPFQVAYLHKLGFSRKKYSKELGLGARFVQKSPPPYLAQAQMISQQIK